MISLAEEGSYLVATTRLAEPLTSRHPWLSMDHKNGRYCTDTLVQVEHGRMI